MQTGQNNNHLRAPASLNFFELQVPAAESVWGKGQSGMVVTRLATPRGRIFKIENLLSPGEQAYLVDAVNTNGWNDVPVGGSRHTEFQQGSMTGSYRASANSPWLAEVLWKRLSPFLGGEHILSDQSLVDWENVSRWKAVGLAPLARFVKYVNGCEALLPHYDESITFENGYKSMVRVLVYLSSSLEGGNTYFVKDPEINLPYSQMRFEAHTKVPTDGDIMLEVKPKAGDALVFDHKILHGSRFVTGNGEKLTLRTDILYTKSS